MRTFDNVLSRPLDMLSAGTSSFSLGPLVQVPMYLWHDVNSTDLCHYQSLMVLNDCFVLSGNSLAVGLLKKRSRARLLNRGTKLFFFC